MQSALAERAKCHTMRGTVNYVQYTLQRCLSRQKVFWQASAKGFKSRKPVGRPLSAVTKSVLEGITQYPAMRACEIARNLSLKPAAVRKVLSGYPMRSNQASRTARALSMGPRIVDEPNPVGSSTQDSNPPDAVLQAIRRYSSWVKVTTIARETRRHTEAVKNQLQQLETWVSWIVTARVVIANTGNVSRAGIDPSALVVKTTAG
jgi:hypothetical protein